MLQIMTRIGIKRKPEFKQLNFDTAMRNPERLKDVLLLIKEYEGVELNDKNLLDIVCDMYESGIVKSSKFNIKKLHSKEQIQNKVIDINKTRNSDGGFPKGYQSRFWTYMRTLSEFGFVYARYNKRLIIGDVAKRLIRNEIDSQEAFSIQTMKYNWRSPYRNVSNDYNYFKFIIKVLKELDKKGKKLSYNQFVVSLFSKEDDVENFLNIIEKNSFPTENSVYEYLNNTYGKQNSFGTVIRDYPDTVLRMLRITGFVNIVNRGVLLIEFNSESEKIVNYFFKHSYKFTEKEKNIDIDYFNKINVVTDDEMKLIMASRDSNIEIMNYNFVLNKIISDYELNMESILEYISNIEVKGKNAEFKYIDAPLQFEFFLSLLLYLVYGENYSIRPNYKTDAYGMPISHAPGNCGDIEIVGKGIYWLLEVTLIRNKTQQLNNETTNLFRHISNQEWNEKYMSLVAPYVHEDTYNIFNALIINYIRKHKKGEFNAKCYTTEEFIQECVSKNIFIDMKKYTDEYIQSIKERL